MGPDVRPVVVIAEVLAASCAEFLGESRDVVEAAGNLATACWSFSQMTNWPAAEFRATTIS